MTRCADRDNAPEARGLAMVDVTMRGAGIFGLSIAWECLQRGASVQVIDPYGVASGASGGLVGALAPHVDHAKLANFHFNRGHRSSPGVSAAGRAPV